MGLVCRPHGAQRNAGAAVRITQVLHPGYRANRVVRESGTTRSFDIDRQRTGLQVALMAQALGDNERLRDRRRLAWPSVPEGLCTVVSKRLVIEARDVSRCRTHGAQLLQLLKVARVGNFVHVLFLARRAAILNARRPLAAGGSFLTPPCRPGGRRCPSRVSTSYPMVPSEVASSSMPRSPPIRVAKSPAAGAAVRNIGHVDGDQIHGDAADEGTALAGHDDLRGGLVAVAAAERRDTVRVAHRRMATREARCAVKVPPSRRCRRA